MICVFCVGRRMFLIRHCWFDSFYDPPSHGRQPQQSPKNTKQQSLKKEIEYGTRHCLIMEVIMISFRV